jgi:hypothetical protein
MHPKFPWSSPGFYSWHRFSRLTRAHSRSNLERAAKMPKTRSAVAVADRGRRSHISEFRRTAVGIGRRQANCAGRSAAKSRISVLSQRVSGYSVYPESVHFGPWVISDTVTP